MAWPGRVVTQVLLVVFLFGPVQQAQAQNCPALSRSERQALRAEHLFGGQPSPGPILVRRAYVTQYDAAHRVPRWTAWEVTPEFLDPPERTGQWAQFRTDASVPNPVTNNDYTGVGAIDMARGHIAPYFIAGGDRDHDGLLAEDDLDDA